MWPRRGRRWWRTSADRGRTVSTPWGWLGSEGRRWWPVDWARSSSRSSSRLTLLSGPSPTVPATISKGCLLIILLNMRLNVSSTPTGKASVTSRGMLSTRGGHRRRRCMMTMWWSRTCSCLLNLQEWRKRRWLAWLPSSLIIILVVFKFWKYY